MLDLTDRPDSITGRGALFPTIIFNRHEVDVVRQAAAKMLVRELDGKACWRADDAGQLRGSAKHRDAAGRMPKPNPLNSTG